MCWHGRNRRGVPKIGQRNDVVAHGWIVPRGHFLAGLGLSLSRAGSISSGCGRWRVQVSPACPRESTVPIGLPHVLDTHFRSAAGRVDVEMIVERFGTAVDEVFANLPGAF